MQAPFGACFFGKKIVAFPVESVENDSRLALVFLGESETLIFAYFDVFFALFADNKFY